MPVQDIVLLDDWKQIATGQTTIILVSGSEYWVYNGTVPPPDATRLRDFIPLTGDYKYEGTENTYCRVAGRDGSVGATVSVGIAFQPSDISGLELRLDALDTDSITFNDSKVSQWDDKSGNGNDAAQITEAFQPTFVSNGLNGRPTIRFPNVAGLGLEISGGIGIGLNAARTLVMVINPAAGKVSSEIIGKDTGNMIDFGIFRQPNDFNSPDRIRFRNGDDTPTDVYSAQGTVPYGQPHVITVTQDVGVNTLNVWNGSVQIVANALNDFDWAMSTNLGIGKSSAAGRDYEGDISEMLTYSSVITTSERLRLLSYANNRWGF